MSYTKKNFLYIELLLFLAPLYAASLHTYIMSHLNSYNSYQTEIYLMIFWIYTISGLRFFHAIIASVLVFSISVISSYIFYPNQFDLFIIHTSWAFSSLVFGFVGGYLLQESQKETFLKQLELEDLASTDKLTGLYNRVKLDEVLSQELKRAQRYNYSVGLLLLDIDFFKLVNDTYGHLSGDKFLVELSKHLKEQIRSSDTAFRWGGEEFIIIVPQVDKEGLMKLAKNLRTVIEGASFSQVGKQTISIGSTISSVTDAIISLIQRADKSLYKAKNSGRNCVVFTN